MAVDKYASVARYFASQRPVGVTDNDDANRLLAYDVYESFYWNVPDSFKIVARSEDANPIYIPSARKIIEATNRFLGIDWDFLVNPRVGLADDQAVIKGLIRNLFRRELVYAKFGTQKRNGLIRGDALWHVTADPSKELGTRVSLHELDPRNYFPIVDPDNPDRLIGCHIVDRTVNPADTQEIVARRQTYRRTEGGIESSLTLFKLDKWDDRDPENDIEQVAVVTPPTILPESIRTIPVYHIRNMRDATLWGSSDLRGVETVIAGISQAASDQDLAISLQGLGVYWTDAGPPKDAEGNDAAFILGPGEVVEVPPGSNFGRVSGIGSGLPGIEHMNFISDETSRALGVPDIAQGRVDVTVAESGISLYLQMAPLLAKNAEKEQEFLGVYDHMLYDLVHQWLPAYEEVGDLQVEVSTVVGDPMPENREAKIAEILTLVTSVPPLITVEMAQSQLSKLGYDFPDGAADQVLVEAGQIAAARGLSDPYASRYRTEVNGEVGQGAQS